MNNSIKGFLCWVIGTQPSFDVGVFGDEDAVLNEIMVHKLLFILLHKANTLYGSLKNAVNLFPKSFIEKSLREVYVKRTMMGRQSRIISAINNRMPSCGFPIKGIVPYLLMQQERYIRNSGDIDYVCNDSEAMEDTILSMGGRVISKSLSGHEQAVFKLNNVCIESHIGFPVIHIPEDAMTNSSTTEPLLTEILSYEYMRSHLVWCQDISGYIPNLELTALIFCLHVYKDFYWEPYNTPKVRLGDIYILHEMVNSTRFKLADFMYMADESRAMPAVEFTMNLINSIWDYGGLSDCMMSSSHVLLKTANAIYGSYVDIGNKWADLPFMDVNDTVNALRWGDILLPYTMSTLKDTVYRVGYGKNDISVTATLRYDGDLVIAIINVICTNRLRSVMLATEGDFGHVYFSNKEVSKQYGFFSKLTLKSIVNKLVGVEIQYTLRTYHERYVPIIITAECFCADDAVAQVVMGKRIRNA